MERWLHQHIFKVGWLLTKNLQTTTILYYTFFLPGVVIHEIVYWLVAGIVNVRAERAIAMPEAQAIAELRLTFIQLSRNAGRIKRAIIGISPLITGLLLIWLISNNVLNLNLVIAILRADGFDGICSAINVLVATPDIWLWTYFMFAIANTMIPDSQTLRAWRPVLIVVGALLVVLFGFGLGQQVFLENLAVPIMDGMNRLALILAVVVVVDLLATGVLGLIESIIERITGDSATFQNGKLVAVRREEILRQREEERAKHERQRQRQAAKTRAPAGPPSIYALPLPIPGVPGRDTADPVIVSREQRTGLPSGQPPRRVEPSVIAGTAAVVKTDEEVASSARPLQEARIDLPAQAVHTLPHDDIEDEDDDDYEDDEDDSDDDDLL